MSTKDPVLGGPQLSYPEEHRPVSRSPSRSPRKHAPPTSLDLDPLLRDLSPTTTLRVLGASTDATGANTEDKYKFIGSISLASNSEKAFGIRVAKTTKQLRSWCHELEQWEWSGTFEVPAAEQRAAKRRRMIQSHSQSSNGSRETFLDTSDSEEEEEYWGSLPSAQIRAYETRVEDIREEMEELDVEELKNHVLQSHIPSRSRPVSSYSEPRSDLFSSSSLAHLDELTALITATILQALPHLSRLTQLLSSWSIRLAVLRKAPAFLKELKDAQNALKSGWTAIHPKHPATTNPSSTPSSPSSPSTAKYSADMTRGASDTIRSVLENKVSELGHRLDSILDDLEGREETVPDSWIDEFESLEADYSCWAVEVERIAQESEWRTLVERDHNRHVPVQSAPINERAGLDMKDRPMTRNDKFSGVPLSGRNMASPVPAVYVPNGDAEGQQKTDLMYHAQGTASRQISTGLSQMGARDGVSSGSPTEGGAEAKRKPTRVRSIPIVIDYESQGALPFEGSKYLSRPLESPTTPDAQASSLANHGGRSNHERGRSGASSADSPFDSATETSYAITKYRTGKENRPLSPQDNSPARSFEKAPQALKRFLPMTKSKSPHHSSRSRSGSDTRTTIGQLPAVKRDRSVGSPAKAESTAADRLSYGWPGRNKPSVRIASLNGDVRPRSLASDIIQSEQASRSSSKRASRVVSAPERALALEPDIPDVPDVPDVPEVPYVPNIITSTSLLGSPFASPTEATPPENWPLIPQEEIYSPKKTLAASSFERMFVDSLPNTPEVNAKGKSEEDNPMEQAEPGTPKEPVVHGSVVDAEEPVAATSGERAGRPHHLTIRRRDEMLRPITETNTPGSLGSNISSPEVRDAAAAEYFRPIEVHTPPPLSRTASATIAKSGMNVFSRDKRNSMSPLSLRLQIPNSASSHLSNGLPREGVDGLATGDSPSRPIFKRASVTSIEAFPRSELRSIEVRRSGSFSSMSSSILGHHQPTAEEETRSPTSPLSARPDRFPSSPTLSRSSQPSSPVSVSDAAESPIRRRLSQASSPLTVTTTQISSSPSVRPATQSVVAKAIVPPLNAAMSKRRGNDHVGPAQRVRNFSKSSPDFRASNGSSATPEITSNGSPPKQIGGNSEEQLQRKISTIIDSIPARIRFASGPGPDAPEVARPRTAPTPPKPITGPALTLAPADSTPSKRGSDDIKLYHLSQAGKDQPIKLFVRLVGEGERVMVRVGGGWADLGEYLRQYAEHHGRRTVSDGKSEAAGLPPTTNISIRTLPTAGTRTPLSSRPGSKVEAPRPDSARSGRMSRLGHDETANNGTPHAASSNTPTPAPRSASSNTPSSSSSTRPSPPSRSSSRLSWTGDEMGLAGPASSKRGEMSAAKQKWVEDMIEQAKKASGETKKPLPDTHGAGRGKVDFGGMGKVGGTRRVFLKGADTGGAE